MAREYARIRISIANDEAIEALSPPAQWLYFRVLIPEPTLSHCGIADWRPRRLTGKARGLTLDYITAAAAELEEARHALFDLDTEEVLVRSYIRTEELLRNPKMATALIGSYRAIASKTLRAAVVSEIKRANIEHPEYSAWKAGDIGTQLAEIMASKSSDEVPYMDVITNPIGNHIGNTGSVQISNGHSVPIGDVVPGADYQSDSVPIPCSLKPADTSMQLKEGGYVSQETHLANDPAANHPPSRYCSIHPNGTPAACIDCQAARIRYERWDEQRKLAERDERRAFVTEQAELRKAAIDNCELCDTDGYLGTVVCDHVDRSHQPGRLAAMAALKPKEGAE